MADPSGNVLYSFTSVTIGSSAVPEPGTYAVLAGGAALLGAFVLRRRQQHQS